MSFTGKIHSLMSLRHLARGGALCLSLCGAALAAQAQEEPLSELDQLPIPPPFVHVASDDRAKLSALRDTGDRAKAALELADARIDAAERATVAGDFDKAISELALYQGLINDTLKHLLQNKGKRDQFKRLEIALRGHASRLESIRRTLPAEYAGYVRKIIEFARDARTTALEPFFSPPGGRQKNG